MMILHERKMYGLEAKPKRKQRRKGESEERRAERIACVNCDKKDCKGVCERIRTRI